MALLSDRFGTSWAPRDQVLHGTDSEELIERSDIQQQAAANSPQNFGLILAKEFQPGVLDHLSSSEDTALTSTTPNCRAR